VPDATTHQLARGRHKVNKSPAAPQRRILHTYMILHILKVLNSQAIGGRPAGV
jgi:hypothetical protein